MDLSQNNCDWTRVTMEFLGIPPRTKEIDSLFIRYCCDQAKLGEQEVKDQVKATKNMIELLVTQ